MATDFYHCRLKVFGRGVAKPKGAGATVVQKGRSAVACAAYRAGMALQDEKYGTLRDFSRKSDVVCTFTLAPENAPEWASDITQLWNRVEAFEKRKDSQLAYEWEIALPNEVDPASREAIAREFASWLVEQYGVAVTVGIHEGGNRGNGLNDHMHVMMTRRGVNEVGFEPKILPQFSVNPNAPENPEVIKVRQHVAGLINEALEDAGSDTRVDHRSFKQRGIDREPTRHLGPAATAYERQGLETERGNINRDIREAVEDRLAWQETEAQPEISADLERDFTETPEDAPPPGKTFAPAQRDLDQLRPEEPPTQQAAEAEQEPRRSTPWGDTWRAFCDRARAFAGHLQDLWSDGSSEAGINVPEPTTPEGPQAQAPEPEPARWRDRLRGPDGEPKGMRRILERFKDILGNERGSGPGVGFGDEPDDGVDDWTQPLPYEMDGDDTPEQAPPIIPEPDGAAEPQGPSYDEPEPDDWDIEP